MTGAVLAALAGAALFGLASALQHREAAAVETSAGPSLLLALARRPLWLVGMVVDISAVALQALALRLGSVSLVQTLLVAGLPLGAALSALLARRRLRGPEVIGLVLCSVGLALLGPQLASVPQGHPPSRHAALVATAVIAALAGPLLLARHHPRFGGAAAGAGAGLVLGSSAVLLSVTAGRIGDWSHLLGSWAVYATVVVGLLALLLTQVAFQTGELGAPLAAISLVEPITAVVIAVNVLDERAPSLTVTAALGTVAAAAGVLVLARG